MSRFADRIVWFPIDHLLWRFGTNLVAYRTVVLFDPLSIITFCCYYCTNCVFVCVWFVSYTMAHAGQNVGDDIWEDASDIFEIRSEVGSSGTLTPDELGHDDSESSQPEDVNPQRANRLERPPARLMNPAMERESARDRTHAHRGADSRIPPSDYQLAPMVFNSSSKRSKSSHQSPSPVRERPNGPSKHREVKSVMKPPAFWWEGWMHRIPSGAIWNRRQEKRLGR